MIIDPVCGMHVDPENAPAFSTIGGHTFYFCSDTCKLKFDADPDAYIDKALASYPEGCEEPKAA